MTSDIRTRSLGHRRFRGAIFIELAFSLATLSILIAGLAVSIDGFGRFNHYQHVRRQCTAAARAQLDSITATGKRLDAALAEELWPDVVCELSTAEGKGPWQGLTRVDVSATAPSYNRTVTLHYGRYVTKLDKDV